MGLRDPRWSSRHRVQGALASTVPLTFVTSTDFERKLIVGSFLRRLGCVFVARAEPARTVDDLEEMVHRARAGSRLAIFPEGSIARAPGLRPFHLGAFAVSAATGYPIVPVGISGTRRILRAGSYVPRRGSGHVVVGQSVPAPSRKFTAQAAVGEMVRQELARLIGERVVEPLNLPIRRPRRLDIIARLTAPDFASISTSRLTVDRSTTAADWMDGLETGWTEHHSHSSGQRSISLDGD